MKKLLFGVLCSLTFMSFAEVNVEKIIKWQNFTDQECAALDAYKGKNKAVNGFKIASEIDRAGKKDSKVFIDYATYKSTFEGIISKYDKESYHGYALVQIAVGNSKIRKGNIPLLIFKEFKDGNRLPSSNVFYVQEYYIGRYDDSLKKDYSANDFAEWFFKVNEKNYASLNRLVDFVQKNILDMDEAKTLTLLKKIKKVSYPNIADDKWKQLLVKVEMMIKSLE